MILHPISVIDRVREPRAGMYRGKQFRPPRTASLCPAANQWPRTAGRVLGALIVVGGLATGCTNSADPPQKTAAQRFLNAVGTDDVTTASRLTSSPGAARGSLRETLAGLGSAAKGTFHVTTVDTRTATAIANFHANWKLPGTTALWRYSGRLPLRRTGDRWTVVWAPSDVSPGLSAGLHVQLRRVQPPRASLNASDGTPIFVKTPVVCVGIEPRLVHDLHSLADALAAVPQLQSTAAEISRAVRTAANPADFVPIITLRRSVYEQIRSRIHELPGIVSDADTELLPPSSHFAEPLLGSVGPATADLIRSSKGRIADGDETGIGGLQQALDSKLAGTPEISVVAAAANGTARKTLAVLSRSTPGTPVTLTLDRSIQTAAESALSGIRQQASIVAVQRLTGRILADANSASATYDLGLAAAVPPGSTFKIATWVAAFTAHPELTALSVVPCPASTVVDGRTFVNENRFSDPPIPISAAFGYSCNTSAITQAIALPGDAVRKAAVALGLGATWSLPVTSFSGSVPSPSSRTERAADAIGQGRVQVSPLLMALMAAAATSGSPVRPSLFAGTTVRRGAPLPPSLPDKMTALMKATVELPRGTGHALADIPGVEGKTGTAEHSNDRPPHSHTWFPGVRGDIAFAVFVYDGASAGLSAVTITHAFLDALR